MMMMMMMKTLTIKKATPRNEAWLVAGARQVGWGRCGVVWRVLGGVHVSRGVVGLVPAG
jgi:hypothetical protein